MYTIQWEGREGQRTEQSSQGPLFSRSNQILISRSKTCKEREGGGGLFWLPYHFRNRSRSSDVSAPSPPFLPAPPPAGTAEATTYYTHFLAASGASAFVQRATHHWCLAAGQWTAAVSVASHAKREVFSCSVKKKSLATLFLPLLSCENRVRRKRKVLGPPEKGSCLPPPSPFMGWDGRN